MSSNKRRQEWRKERQQKGLCPECGEPRGDLTKYLCTECQNRFRRYSKDYYTKPHIKIANRIRNREWRRNNPGRIFQSSLSSSKWQKDNIDRVRTQQKIHRQRLKEHVFTHYGNKCACCGESHFEFLTIDHINNDGNEHRKKVKGMSGYRIYSWIKRNDYPSGFQLLCWNCNVAKSVYSICPHQVEG